MSADRRWLFVVVALIVAGSSRPAVAATPWNKLALFKQLPSDPQEDYPLKDDHGPWMIMASTFSGPGAEDQARQLVHELRKDFKLPAYSYHKKFEYSKPIRGKGLTPQGEAPLMRYRQHNDVVEIAVMVGDFPTIDDPELKKVLKRVKAARPKSLSVAPEKSTQALASYRTMQQQAKEAFFPKEKAKEGDRGPMSNAFVVTNPLLPPEYFVPKGIDKLVVEMNKEVKYSLMKCPAKYTVKVATFTGNTVLLDQKVIDLLEKGAKPKSHLEKAAEKANLLTEALRKAGYEAYEFHERNSSIVTVGAFETVGNRRADGKIEINPAVHQILRKFGAETTVEPGKPPSVGKSKTLADVVGKQAVKPKAGMIEFDMQAMPVEVPRVPISAAYERTARAR